MASITATIMSDDEDDTTTHRTAGLLDLPLELQLEVFLALFNQQSVIALRLTCRDLENVYQRFATTISLDQRERIVAPFREYLEFLMRLKLPKDSLRYPPPDGWPHIEPGPGKGFEIKTAFAVEILRHLPYMHSELHYNDETSIAYRSAMEDYSTKDYYQGYRWEVQSIEPLYSETKDSHEIKPSALGHMLCLAVGWGPGGLSIFIDTLTGLVFEEEEEGNPSASRILARDYFEDRVKTLLRFDEVFVPVGDVIFRRDNRRDHKGLLGCDRYLGGRLERFRNIIPDDDPYDAEEMERQGEYDGTGYDFGEKEDGDWVRHLHFKHGWPGEQWDKEACLEDIRGFVDRRRARSGRY